jgi:DNA-binding NarL/FixJ family response regulator
MNPIRVSIHVSEPVKRAGVAALLRGCPAVELLIDAERANADVLVLVESTVTVAHLNTMRRIRAESAGEQSPRCVIVTDRFDRNDIMSAVQSGVVSILPSGYASQARLVSAVVGAVRGDSLLPRDLQAALLRQLDELRRNLLEPNGLTLSGLGLRELDAIRLVAEGFRTDEIASKLACSEGTVKTLLYGAMKRLGLTNRTHAVAYAIRAGVMA